MTRGAQGEWDAVDVLNPSVIRQGDAYYNFFSGYDGKTWHTGLAVSADGVTWRKEGKILSPDPALGGHAIAANGSAIADDSGILYYYQAGDPVADRPGAIAGTAINGSATERRCCRWVRTEAGMSAAWPTRM